jgi:hypothetical protein
MFLDAQAGLQEATRSDEGQVRSRECAPGRKTALGSWQSDEQQPRRQVPTL